MNNRLGPLTLQLERAQLSERATPYGFRLDPLRSFAASFWLPNFCHPFSIAAEKVLSLGPARCPASFKKG